MQCTFEFQASDYPEEFPLEKLRNMFHPFKNKTGYTRDHIVSIYEGFRQGIDPKLIKHPANCQLMLHAENSRKNSRADLTLDELIERIQSWTLKYGESWKYGES